MAETKTLIPMIQLEEIKALGWDELEQIGGIARERNIPFHVAFIIWKADIK